MKGWSLERREQNRAATPFFEIFGGDLKVPAGDAVRMASGSGLHRGEWRFYSWVVPLVVGAAVFDALHRLGGAGVAWCGVVPLAFLTLQVLGFVIGGSSPSRQWMRWEMVLLGWGCLQLFVLRDGGVGWAVLLWGAVFLLNGLGAAGLVWGELMNRPLFQTTGFRWLLAIAAHVPALVIGWVNGWPWGVAFQALVAGFWCWGTFRPGARIFGPVATRVEGKDVLLTIDDGPDPVDTPALLDLLDRHDRKAVFFVIGEKVKRHPELAREILRRGHELGNHTLTHPAAFMWGMGPGRTRREIVGCNQVIEEVTGVRPRWYRAPAGHRNWFTHPVLRECGLELVAWNRRGFDAVRTDVPEIVASLTDDAGPGDILLLHEATPVAAAVMKGTLEALDGRATSPSR
ncbi:polysaccharide deacetylase family protein [Luteolibacter marinus]|uniref:polysaccharide deacetylase family protein n=1 Tax=Luteolibacter marinus TaxID=2776705 RepID=UPI001867C257|nr:polysaccharide deacetylase family protein [Luteolibacter marinus]